MTPERIAEINRIACNLDRENPAYGALNEALDALEAAQQEIADLKRGGVVVPDDDRPSREFLENYVEGFDPGERSAALFGWREGRRHLREHSSAIPADRVLGEGKVAVDREELCLLRQLESGWREPYDLSAGERARIIARLDALRAQPTQEPTT